MQSTDVMELPSLSSIQCVDALWRLGFKIVDANDHRVRLQRDTDGRRVSVPRHKTLAVDEIRVILIVAGVESNAFTEVLQRRGMSGEIAPPGEVVSGIRSRGSLRPPWTRERVKR